MNVKLKGLILVLTVIVVGVLFYVLAVNIAGYKTVTYECVDNTTWVYDSEEVGADSCGYNVVDEVTIKVKRN